MKKYSTLLSFLRFGALLMLLTVPAKSLRAQEVLPACRSSMWIQEVFVSPTFRQDHTLFLRVRNEAEDRGEVWLSRDGGLTSDMILADSWVFHVAVSPSFATNQTLLVLLDDRLAVSHDGGATWVYQVSPGHGFGSVVITGNGVWFAFLNAGNPGGYDPQREGVFASTDEGVTWRQVYSGKVYAMNVSPLYEQDQTLFISPGGYKYNGGLLRSTDGGATWQASNTGLGYGGADQVHKIAFSPGYAQDRTLYVDSNAAFWRSTDAGITWQQVHVGEPAGGYDRVVDFVLSPRYPEDRALFIHGGQYGFAASRDAGVTWQPFSQYIIPLATMDDCRGAACSVVVVGRYHESAALYKSYDYGQTWQCLETPFAPPTPPPAEIPEPATLLLLAGGVAALAGYGTRCRRGLKAQRD